MRLPPVLVALAAAVLLSQGPLCGAQVSSSPSTVVTVAVTAGEDELLPGNMSVWDQFPVVLSDQIEYSIAATLNSLASGSTTTPPPSSSTDDSDGGMSWYVILGIAGGGLVVIAAIALLAMNGVMLNKGGAQVQAPPQPAPAPPSGNYAQVPQAEQEPTQRPMYRPPRPDSKVIQVVLTPPGRASV